MIHSAIYKPNQPIRIKYTVYTVFNSSVAGSDVEIIVPAVSTGLGAKCKTKK